MKMNKKILFEVIFPEGKKIAKVSMAEFEYLSEEKGIRFFQKKFKIPLFFLDSYSDVRKRISFLVDDCLCIYEISGLIYLVKEDTYCCVVKNKFLKSTKTIKKSFVKII